MRIIQHIATLNNTRSLLATAMHDLTGFQRDLLYTIGGLGEPHGLAIKEQLEDYYESEVHHGRLYPNLDTLVEKGLISKSEADRRTNIYSLNRRGRREIQDRRDWEDKLMKKVDPKDRPVRLASV